LDDLEQKPKLPRKQAKKEQAASPKAKQPRLVLELVSGKVTRITKPPRKLLAEPRIKSKRRFRRSRRA
jgi:hypothetical protein